ncbi:hypothetical protein [Micromonospora chersina]
MIMKLAPWHALATGAAVATAAGLAPTDVVHEGEIRWTGPAGS